jgi:hypothetical protein
LTWRPTQIYSFLFSNIDADLVFVKGGKFVLGQDHAEWDKLPQFMRPPDSDKRQEELADFFIGTPNNYLTLTF